MRRGAVMVIALALVVGLSQAAYAADPLMKLGRGLVNAATGFLEVPKNIYEVSKEHEPFTGLIWGSMKGSGWAAARTSVGAYEVATFPLPKYEPMMEPEYVF